MADRRLKARLPKGLLDRSAAELAAERRMLETIRAVYERYGFEAVETPFIEYTDALGKFLPDLDRPNEGVFSFQDEDEQWLSLRYDLTAPLARYFAEHYDSLPKPYRSYRLGYVFRNEKPGPGRFRQFLQFDADTVGSNSPAADAEMCMMAADALEAIGIPRGSYVIKVNNRKILDGVMEAIGLGGEENAARRLIVLRAVDKLDRLGVEGVRQLLGEGRKDESGDFTKGAGLGEADANFILDLFGSDRLLASVWTFSHEQPGRAENDMVRGTLQGRDAFKDNYEQLQLTASVLKERGGRTTGVDEVVEIIRVCEAGGYGSNRIVVDGSVVRGLEYYTGPVFEAELTFDTTDEKGRPVRFGSVGGGGRYDGLVSRFRGEPAPATGFSIGVSRLAAALKHLGKLDAQSAFGPVVVTVFDRDPESLARYQRFVQMLREAPIHPARTDGPKIRAELYLGNPKNFGNQLKYADRRNAPCVIIQGSEEKARGEVQIKDLVEGAKAAAAIASNQEWRSARAAQISCKVEDMVAEVQKILERHGVG